MILLEKIQFEGRNRLQAKVRGFIYGLPEKMRQIRGAFWKKEHGWLLPDTDETVRSLKEIFGQEQIVVLPGNTPEEEPEALSSPLKREPSPISLRMKKPF
ncbi:MAG: hypothetical protein SF052_06700 [Bacteroidia bacterium]|nr:hypothetical protein [Bacteroidia bacterium]